MTKTYVLKKKSVEIFQSYFKFFGCLTGVSSAQQVLICLRSPSVVSAFSVATNCGRKPRKILYQISKGCEDIVENF